MQYQQAATGEFDTVKSGFQFRRQDIFERLEIGGVGPWRRVSFHQKEHATGFHGADPLDFRVGHGNGGLKMSVGPKELDLAVAGVYHHQLVVMDQREIQGAGETFTLGAVATNIVKGATQGIEHLNAIVAAIQNYQVIFGSDGGRGGFVKRIARAQLSYEVAIKIKFGNPVIAHIGDITGQTAGTGNIKRRIKAGFSQIGEGIAVSSIRPVPFKAPEGVQPVQGRREFADAVLGSIDNVDMPELITADGSGIADLTSPGTEVFQGGDEFVAEAENFQNSFFVS